MLGCSLITWSLTWNIVNIREKISHHASRGKIIRNYQDWDDFSYLLVSEIDLVSHIPVLPVLQLHVCCTAINHPRSKMHPDNNQTIIIVSQNKNQQFIILEIKTYHRQQLLQCSLYFAGTRHVPISNFFFTDWCTCLQYLQEIVFPQHHLCELKDPFVLFLCWCQCFFAKYSRHRVTEFRQFHHKLSSESYQWQNI